MLRAKIKYSGVKGEDWVEVVAGFKKKSGLPSIHGTIDIIQIHIEKPNGPFAKNIIPSNPKHSTCNYILWLTIGGRSKMCLWGCLA